MQVRTVNVAKNKRHGEFNVIINDKYAYIFGFADYYGANKKAQELQNTKRVPDEHVYQIADVHYRDLEIIQE
jgi:hypothetical protein